MLSVNFSAQRWENFHLLFITGDNICSHSLDRILIVIPLSHQHQLFKKINDLTIKTVWSIFTALFIKMNVLWIKSEDEFEYLMKFTVNLKFKQDWINKLFSFEQWKLNNFEFLKLWKVLFWFHLYFFHYLFE